MSNRPNTNALASRDTNKKQTNTKNPGKPRTRAHQYSESEEEEDEEKEVDSDQENENEEDETDDDGVEYIRPRVTPRKYEELFSQQYFYAHCTADTARDKCIEIRSKYVIHGSPTEELFTISFIIDPYQTTQVHFTVQPDGFECKTILFKSVRKLINWCMKNIHEPYVLQQKKIIAEAKKQNLIPSKSENQKPRTRNSYY